MQNVEHDEKSMKLWDYGKSEEQEEQWAGQAVVGSKPGGGGAGGGDSAGRSVAASDLKPWDALCHYSF